MVRHEKGRKEELSVCVNGENFAISLVTLPECSSTSFYFFFIRMDICNSCQCGTLILRSTLETHYEFTIRCVKIELMIYSFNMIWPRRLKIWFFNHFSDCVDFSTIQREKKRYLRQLLLFDRSELAETFGAISTGFGNSDFKLKKCDKLP